MELQNNKLEENIKIYKQLKQIWENKNVLIIEGYNSKLGLGNNLFENSKSLHRLLCPNKNSYSYLEEIYNQINKIYKNYDLLLVALGPTASILVTMISKNMSIQALDIGHIDVVYMWFLNKAKECLPIADKNVNEEKKNINDKIFVNYDEIEYQNQIIAKIGENNKK